MSEIQTTGRRREVGAELKRFRRRHKWPAYELAEKLGWTPSHISRSEAGKRRVTDVDAGHYLGMCGVSDHELQDLLTLVNEPDDYRLHLHQDRIPDQMRALTFFESTATKINSFEPIYVPCVAQTPDYARALFGELGLDDPAQIDQWVQLRMRRSEILRRPNPPHCVYLVHENALRMPVGGPQVMGEQLRHLLLLGKRLECFIRVVPISAGARGLSKGAFQIFDFDKEDPSVVCFQHETTTEFLETDAEVARGWDIMERLASVCLDGPESKAFLTMLASDFERDGDTPYDIGEPER
jgi:transcriptional regulator with XRE-family HTH domain